MKTDQRRHLVAHLRKEIHLGVDCRSGKDVFIPLEDMKSTSVHVLGASGYGKSYFLRNLIQQFIRHNQPFALIDPHRDLHEYAVSALRRSAIASNRLVLLDPSDEKYSTAFNPLYCGVNNPNDAASLVLEACLKAWGHDSFDHTPRLEGMLRGMFRLLLDSRLTLLEASEVLNVDNARLRALLRERVGDEHVRQDWEEFEKLPRQEKLAVVESSRNRLRRFIQSERVQFMLGQTENTVDLQQVMDEGQFLLANIGGVRSAETQRLLGSLLVNGFYHAAKQRDPRTRRPYFVIVDEAGQYATSDLANSLDELRKFGVHFILAHQRLAQLSPDDSDILSAVLTNAKIKIVFGGLERLEAERMARELFTGQVHGRRTKHVSYATKFRPVFDTFEVESESWSESEGSSEGSISSSSSGESESEEAIHDGFEYTPRGRAQSHVTSDSRGDSRTRSHSNSSSRSLVPITRHEKFEEETGRQYWSVDEQWEALIARVHSLPRREALVRPFNGPVLHIRTADVKESVDERAAERFREKVLQRCPYVKSSEEVRREIENRRERLAELVQGPSTKPALPDKPTTFRE